MKRLCSAFLFSLIFLSITSAQNLTGESTEIRETILDANNITSVIYNYGSIGAPNRYGNIADIKWRRLGYMFEFGPLLAAEVIDKNGNVQHIVDDSFVRTFQGDYDPTGTVKWGWLPRAGYSNSSSDQIAQSADPSTWHENWNSWPGEFGNGVIVGNNEAFYMMDDFTNAEFPYYPSKEDSSKRGLGVSAMVRIYQFNDSVLKDAMLIKYFIINESDKALDKAYFGFTGDPHIGGPSDYGDDRVHVLLGNPGVEQLKFQYIKNSVYLWDDDMRGFGGMPAGYLVFKLIDTPDSLNLTAFRAATYTNSLPNVPMNDPMIWEWFDKGIVTENDLYNNPGDNMILFGSGPFSLAPGETKTVSLVIALFPDYNSFIDRMDDVVLHANWLQLGNKIGDTGGNENFKVEITSPVENVISESVVINWNYLGTNSSAKILVEYSSNSGDLWLPLSGIITSDANFQFDTHILKEGVNYLFRVIAFNPDNPKDYYYSVIDHKIRIDNIDVSAQPELSFTTVNNSEVITSSPLRIKWVSEDADNSQLDIKLEYFFNDDSILTEVFTKTYDNGEHTYVWDITDIPNSDSYYLKLTASDGQSDSSLTIGPLNIRLSKAIVNPASITHIQGRATPDIFIDIVNQNELTGNDYEISFTTDSVYKYMNIKNLNTEEILISDFTIRDNVSTQLFEGMKATVIDKEPDINYEKTHFNDESIEGSYLIYYPPPIGMSSSWVKLEDDWIVAFNDLDTLSDGSYEFPGDTTINQSLSNVICPFYITQIDSSSRKANYLVLEHHYNNQWDYDESIIFRPIAGGQFDVSYAISFDESILDNIGFGDTLFIYTYKSIKNDDKFVFTTDSLITYNKDEIKPADKFVLYNNYPNPFNPSTYIKYQIPRSGNVKLIIYDMLGREVKTLVNGFKQKGKYEVEFDASQLSSGVYIYRISANEFSATKKMILLK